MKKFNYPLSHAARKAFNAKRRKRETWMRPLQAQMWGLKEAEAKSRMGRAL